MHKLLTVILAMPLAAGLAFTPERTSASAAQRGPRAADAARLVARGSGAAGARQPGPAPHRAALQERQPAATARVIFSSGLTGSGDGTSTRARVPAWARSVAPSCNNQDSI